MKLRERQKTFCERSLAALAQHGDTLGVAPTGAGKTVMGSYIAGQLYQSRELPLLFIQHREELVKQNRDTFHLINPHLRTGIYTADRKEWGYDCIFGSIDTIKRAETLAKMPPVGSLIVDEAHHAAADGWQRTIDAFRKKNPKMFLFGMTATPNRGDKRSLKCVFSNCADQVTLKELIEARHLVRPRTMVIDIGVRDELRGVRKLAADFDMTAVEAIMDKTVLNDQIVKHWGEQAAGRQTVIFCSTVAHAQHVAEAFRAAGIRAATVWGDMGDADRRETLAAYDRGEIEILTNVAVLTEGWDHQPTSCVILLRPSSYKSTMLQMIGRGLRKVEPERYPGIHKDDCIVMDFGTSILMHGRLEDEVDLDQEGIKECLGCKGKVPSQCYECPLCGYEFPKPMVDAPTKTCPECGVECGLSTRTCRECGHVFGGGDEKTALGDFILTEVDLLHDSPFRWEKLYDGLVMMANAIDAWACCVAYRGRWWALGGAKEQPIKVLADSQDRLIALASADDYLREAGDTDVGSKALRWLSMPASDDQLKYLQADRAASFGLTRYRASCLLSWKFCERGIRSRLEQAIGREAA